MDKSIKNPLKINGSYLEIWRQILEGTVKSFPSGSCGKAKKVEEGGAAFNYKPYRAS